jgi:protein-disulfide isomerase
VVAAGGIGFIVLMASVVKAWCVYCVFSDLSAIVLGGIGVLLLRAPPDDTRRPAAVPSALAVLIGIATPFVFGLAIRSGAPPNEPQNTVVEPEEVPEPVSREQVPGVATIVEWLDFECPACRAQNEVFERLLPQYGDRVRLIRKMLPLPMHEHAADAAAAYCCAEEARHGEEMAHLLMTSEDVSKEACEAMAEKLGLNLDEFRECVGSERIAKRLAQEKQEAISVGVKALPTYYIGRERFEGGRDDDTIRASIERAIKEAQGS